MPFHFFGQIGGGFKQDHSKTEINITRIDENFIQGGGPVTSKGHPKHFDHKEKGAFADIGVGAAYELSKCLEWEAHIGVNPIKAKEEHKCDVPINGKGASVYGLPAHQAAFKNNIPVHNVRESVYTLEKSVSGHLSTALVFRNAIASPFFGVTASLANFKLGYKEEVDPDLEPKIDDQEVKKMGFGFGPMIGVNFKINKRLSLVVFGNCQMYNKIELNFKKPAWEPKEPYGSLPQSSQSRFTATSIPGPTDPVPVARSSKDYAIKSSPKYWFLGAALRVAFG